MKKLFLNKTLWIAACCLTSLLSCTTSKEHPSPLSVMTFNIRLDAPQDSLNNWKYRKANVGQMINYYAPDLIGLQEVCHNQLEDLCASLKDYAHIGVGRDDGKTKGEYCPIFYNKTKYTLIDQGNFSLSEHPDSIGIKGWDASYNRIATWGVFLDNRTQQRMVYYNTHLDNDGIIARKEGIQLILQHIRQQGLDLPTIISGDFNCVPFDEPLNILENEGFENSYKDARIKYGPSYSFHDFGRLPVSECQQLDYILVSKPMSISRSRVIADKANGWYLSDHFPVFTNILY